MEQSYHPSGYLDDGSLSEAWHGASSVIQSQASATSERLGLGIAFQPAAILSAASDLDLPRRSVRYGLV